MMIITGIKMDSFYVTLLSNVKDDGFFNNTIANFRTQLPSSLVLGKEWVVGLSEVSYTNSWFNVKTPQTISLVCCDSKTLKGLEDKIPPGRYESIKDILALISRAISKYLDPTVALRPRLVQDQYTRRIKLLPGEFSNGAGIYIKLGQELQDMLGYHTFQPNAVDAKTITLRSDGEAIKLLQYVMDKNPDEDDPIGEDEAEAMARVREISTRNPAPEAISRELLYLTDITAGYHSLLVYCNVIEPNLVGNTHAQLLRIIPVRESKFGDQCVLTYDKPHYFPLITREFQNIEIHIKDDTNETVPFKFGRVIVTLHFKKWRLTT
jgi:hypothetical protein